ncbi:MAG: RNA polymerase sigma-70 factor (ECF subfamily) [Planctomycetota bacterium]|jgi:RNA polymerase sigma-70 factor (ECF subfamily)
MASEAERDAQAEKGQKSAEAVNTSGSSGYSAEEMQREATRLMTAAQGGDVDAFNDLVVELRQRAFMVARSLVGSREDALDLCQDAFLKTYKARDSYNPSQPFLPWFHRILRNTCFSFLRKQGRIRKQSLSSKGEDGEDVEWDIVDPAPQPSARIEDQERSDLFQAATALLSSRDREILALRHNREMSYKEIALSLGIPEGTVMSRLFHARRRLRDQLRPVLHGIDDVATPDKQGAN